MKTAILEIYPDRKRNLNRIDAHARNSIELANELPAELLICEQDYIRALKKQYDILILAYVVYYAPHKYIEKLVNNNPNAKKFLINNEYNQSSTLSTFKNFEIITNNYKKYRWKTHVVNLNLLLAKQPNIIKAKKYDCIYYGTYRQNREKYFKRYLKGEMYLSTSLKNMKKYKHLGVEPKYINKLKWIKNKETLNKFRYNLYIEDEYTHNVYNHLANRYYEAGFCNNVVIFDNNCLNTIKKSEISGYDYKEYIVNNYEELQEKIEYFNKNFNSHLQHQKKWRENELLNRQNVIDKIKNIIYN